MGSSTDYPQDQVEQLVALSKAKAFLGREFLTWLWFYIEKNKGKHFVPQNDGASDMEVDLWIDDKLVLESQSARAHESVIKGGDPSHSAEAAYGLRSGKTVKEMKLGFNIGGMGEFFVTLNGADLNPKGLKLPNLDAPEVVTDPDEPPTVTRLRFTELFLNTLDHLFSTFLKDRIGDDFEKATLSDIRSWVKDRDQKDGVTLH